MKLSRRELLMGTAGSVVGATAAEARPRHEGFEEREVELRVPGLGVPAIGVMCSRL
jgi:hypothetical protein